MTSFNDKLRATGYLRRPLKPQDFRNHSYEAVGLTKEVSNCQPLTIEEHQWHKRGQGNGGRLASGLGLFLGSKATLSQWAPGAPADGDYVSYGEAVVYRSFPRENWENFNRLSFKVIPLCEGLPNPHIIVGLKNDGMIKVPDIYDREGYHVVNLDNGVVQEIFLDFPDLPRDAITELSFSTLINGQDKGTSDQLFYEISDIHLQQVASTNSKGWLPTAGAIIYSHNGYQPAHRKTAWMSVGSEETFTLFNEQKQVLSKKLIQIDTTIGQFSLLDFSEVEEAGVYYLKVGQHQTEPFKIGNSWDLWLASAWKSLNFIFCQRCGCPVPDHHSSCHEDIVASHQGQEISFNGGWHDAGDLSQQLIQTAEVTLSLFELADKVSDQQLYLRLMEEAEWGYDFILKTRFGDGNRATSAGVTRWTNGKRGDMDDVVARVHDTAYENFLLAGIEGQIAGYLPAENRLKASAKHVAIADFDFAMADFKKNGFKTTPIFWEHTYSTSKSSYLATIVWTSVTLYQLTKEETYQELAVSWMRELLECQELEGLNLNSGGRIKGFFYRDDQQSVIQHFNHQAREHLYAQAFEAIMTAFPTHSDFPSWLSAAEAYGSYFRELVPFTAPYPMLASGLYLENEADSDSFEREHLLVGEEAKNDYLEQLKQGVKVGQGLYIKRFPVWFSFRGNNAMVLSSGKAVAVIGKLLQDESLKELGASQLQWVLGANPFNQSLMYGEGQRYAQQYAVLPGEMVGELPVGIQTFGNEDQPYWPQLNNATYKEVWTGNAGKWLSLLSEIL